MDKLQTKSEKQYYIPMEVNETSKEFIIANGFNLSTDAVWTKIGHRTVRAIMIPATKEQYLEYMRPLWREDKQGQRASKQEDESKMQPVSLDQLYESNGAAPSGVLEHPGTLKDPSKVRDSWSQTFGGSANSHKVAVLEEGMKYTPISISPNEAQFLETRKFQIDEIARIFRVPPHMVGDLEKSSFSNIEQQSLEFVKYTLDPWVSRWEQNMIRSLLSEEEKKKYFIKFNVDGLLRGDYQSRMNGYATARQNGWMSANDIRELENLDRIPAELGGDLYLINGNMTKLSDAGIFAASQDTSDRKEKTDEEQEVLELEEPKDSKPGKRGSHRTNP